MEIITDLDILRQKSEKIRNQVEINTLIKALEDSLDSANHPNGVGLSAIQIGIPKRVAIIRTNKLSLDLYNAKIIEKEDVFIQVGEGCLSLPGIFKTTMRFRLVTIENGDGKRYVVEGFEAIVVQHEIDHWDGILFIDRIINTTKEGGI